MNPEQKENTTPETETPEQPAPAPETPEIPEKKDDKKGGKKAQCKIYPIEWTQ